MRTARSILVVLPLLPVLLLPTGCEDRNGLTEPTPDEGPALLWSHPGSTHRSGGLVTDGKRVFISWPGGVSALDAETGDHVWEFRDIFVGFVTPFYVLTEEMAIVSWRGFLRGFRAVDGAELWAHDSVPTRWTGRRGEGYPTDVVASDGVDGVYVAIEEELARVDVATGEILWRREPEGTGALALWAGSSAVCSRRSPVVTVACYAESDGRLLWSVGQLEIAPRGGIEVVGARVVVEANDWFGLDLASGDTVWRRDGIDASLARSSSEAAGVLFGCSRVGCFAIRAGDGAELWRRAIQTGSSPAASRDFLFVVGAPDSGSSDLHVLDAGSGRSLDTIRPEEGNSFGARLAYGDGRVFVTTFGDLRAYRYP